jgi:hypothetical protein
MQFDTGSITLRRTRDWLSKQSIEDSKTNLNFTNDLPERALLSLILRAGSFTDLNIPETYRMDKVRIIGMFNDWQDITIIACILLIFKGVAGPKCTFVELARIKEQLWTLLNDVDTTMSHITLQMAADAGKLRGNALTSKEIIALESLVDKTLSSDSPVFNLIQTRIKTHMYLPTNRDLLRKHGLEHCETEINSLSIKIKKLSKSNKDVYADTYHELLRQDIQRSDKEIVNLFINEK